MQCDFTLARSLERHHKVSWQSLSVTSRHFDAHIEGVAPAGAVDEATEVANTVATGATGREVGATAGPSGPGHGNTLCLTPTTKLTSVCSLFHDAEEIVCTPELHSPGSALAASEVAPGADDALVALPAGSEAEMPTPGKDLHGNLNRDKPA